MKYFLVMLLSVALLSGVCGEDDSESFEYEDETGHKIHCEYTEDDGSDVKCN